MTADAQLKCSSPDTCRLITLLIGVESADRQAAPTSLWTYGGNDPSARLVHRLSRMAREIGLLRSDEQIPGTVARVPVAWAAAWLGLGVGTWSGRRTPLAANRRRAGHRPRGMPNLGVEGHLARDLRQPDAPPRPGLSRTRRRHRRSADRRRPSRRTAATLGTSGTSPGEPGTGTRKSDVPVPADRGSSATCQEDM
jgi:hypothetical protein